LHLFDLYFVSTEVSADEDKDLKSWIGKLKDHVREDVLIAQSYYALKECLKFAKILSRLISFVFLELSLGLCQLILIYRSLSFEQLLGGVEVRLSVLWKRCL
jgi:hypothetical protein